MNAEYVPVDSAQIAADMGNIGRVEKLVERVQRPAVTNAHNVAICGALYPKRLQPHGSHKRSGNHGKIECTMDRRPPPLSKHGMEFDKKSRLEESNT